MAKIFRERLDGDGYALLNDAYAVHLGRFDMIEEAHLGMADELLVLNEHEEKALFDYLLIRKQRREDKATEKLVLEKFGTTPAIEAMLGTGKTTTIVQAAQQAAEHDCDEACPGCDRVPGQGVDPSCNDPIGCGYWKSLEAQDNTRF